MSDGAVQTVTFYHPAQGGRAADLRSPDYVQLSTAAAITLGLMPGRMHRVDCTHCLNLLVTYAEGCRANCAYCGLARHREENRDFNARNFIRVDWPTARYRDIIERVRRGGDRGRFQRMCISMITHPRSGGDTLELLEQWVAALPHIPVSILSNPTTMKRQDLVELERRGAEIFTVALDAATPEVFERTRGATVGSPHDWEHYWRAIGWAAEIFGPERFGVHLICGMGETEREMLQVVQRIRDMGGHSHLFAFFPERGSMMEDWPAVEQGQWRRVQIGRYLIDYMGGRVERMGFDAQGRIVDFGIGTAELESAINTGKPFRTSGCPGSGEPDVSACNRPYGDSMPSDIRSFPFPLDNDDLAAVVSQSKKNIRID
jgi:biotin synthase